MTRYRYLDGLGDVVAEQEFPDHHTAIAVADEVAGDDIEVQRVEFLGPEGDWRWAGVLG